MTRKEFVRTLRRSFLHKHGYINPLPEDAEEQLDAAEQKMGFSLPPILRYIYEYAGEDFLSLDWPVGHYVAWRKDPDPSGQPIWPEKMLPIEDVGCGIYRCLDCTRPRAPVLMWRGDFPPEENPSALHFEHESPSFVEFLKRLIPRDDGGYA